MIPLAEIANAINNNTLLERQKKSRTHINKPTLPVDVS